MRRKLLFTIALALLSLAGISLPPPGPDGRSTASARHPTISARYNPGKETPVKSEASTDLETAIANSRRHIRGLRGSESLLPSNAGSLFFANHSGQRFTARFQQDGVLIRSPDGSRELKISRPDAGTA